MAPNTYRLLDASGALVGYSEESLTTVLEQFPGRAWTPEGVPFTDRNYPKAGQPVLPEVCTFAAIPPSGNEAKAARKARAAWYAARQAERDERDRRAGLVAAEVRIAALTVYLATGIDEEHRGEAERMLDQARDILRRNIPRS